MNRIAFYLIIVCLILGGYLGLPLLAKGERGLTLNEVNITDNKGKQLVLYQESHALVIGVSNYTNWPKLLGVQHDVEEVKAVLETHGFNVVVKMDLDKNALIQAFDEFIDRYGHQPDNRLLLYFAGHGETLQLAYGGEMGYLVPVDAPLSNEDTQGFLSKAMDMQQIEVYAKRIQAKHALFVFDSCFSGSIFALSRAAPQSITYKIANPVRQFITSGSANERVPDESIFRQQFIEALHGQGDTNGDGYVTGSELGIFLEDTVINCSKGAQHPQYGKIRDPHLDKGDFVFKLSEQKEDKIIMPIESPPEFSLDDLEALAEYLSKMEDAFSETNEYEQRNISTELKITAWERFVQAFSEDNPYTTRDEELRNTAGGRIRYWEESGVPTSTSTSWALMPTLPPSEIGQLLQKADAYFNKRWFFTPEETNAFDIYQEVLESDPTNYHAREKLYEMMRTYKAWGDANYQKARYTKAKTFYQRSVKIAQYMVGSLGEQSITQEFQELQKQLQELEAISPSSSTRKPTLPPAKIPLSSPPTTLTLEQLGQALSEKCEKYENLTRKERDGFDVQDQILPVLNEIIKLLKELEFLYERSGDPEMLRRIDPVKNARNKFEKEFLKRTY